MENTEPPLLLNAPATGMGRLRKFAPLLLLLVLAAGVWAWASLRKPQMPGAETAPAQSAALSLPVAPAEPVIPAPAPITAPMPAPAAAIITAPIVNALAQATTRIAALETEVENLKTNSLGASAPAADANDAAAMMRMNEAVRGITGSLDAIHNAMTALNARLAAMEAVQAANPPGGEAKNISYALGLRELERALHGSGPYAVQLETIGKLLDASQLPLIAPLREHAATGIATRAQLLARFDAAAADIVRADAAALRSDGWADRAYGFVMSLVMIRPLGEREGLDAPARVARAQARLQEDDLDAAVRELAELEGAAAVAAQAWMKDARARLAAEQALAQLSAALSQQLNNAAAPAPSTEPAGE